MKKKYVIIVLLLVFIVSFGVNKLFFDNSSSVEENIQDVEDVPKNLLSMMLETDTASGEYEMTTRSSWPTIEDGYVFNSSLSKCENGSKLIWDDENNAVVMQASVSDKCYVYFDKLVPPVVVDVKVDSLNSVGSPFLVKAYVESKLDIDSYYFDFLGTGSASGRVFSAESNLPYYWINGSSATLLSKYSDYEISLMDFSDERRTSCGAGDYDISVYVKDIHGQISDTYETSEILPLCFVEGTEVLIDGGYANIEDLKIGDFVYTINETTNKKELKQVISVITSSSKITYEIMAGGIIVEPSSRHPFYVIDKGWTRAYNLEVGDLVLTTNGAVEIEDIKVNYHTEPVKTYNLTIEDNHNFIVTEKEFLVHNSSISPCTPDDTFW